MLTRKQIKSVSLSLALSMRLPVGMHTLKRERESSFGARNISWQQIFKEKGIKRINKN